MAKYIFVTGGVVSSLGKGIASSSLGCLLKSWGLRVNMMKMDPYLNVDPGTMSPYQHGEVFVTEDGAETDLDLGHYERYTHLDLSKANNVTAGQIYQSILDKERRGDYLGKTVQVVPHVTDEIKARIRKLGSNPETDVVLVEVGGTVGDIESLPFLEAIRQMRHEEGRDNTLFFHATLVPFIRAASEIKTKPTQHSVRQLLEIGIQADVLLCRCEKPLTEDLKEKIAAFCNVDPEEVISAHDVAHSIYEVTLNFRSQGLDKLVMRRFRLRGQGGDLSFWEDFVSKIRDPRGEVTIAVVGKYAGLRDAYKSIEEAFVHAGVANGVHVRKKWIEAEDVERLGAAKALEGADGLLIPGGFGKRGIEGKIQAIRYAREEKLPFFGICLGMQCAAIEFARNRLGLAQANSTEFDGHCPDPVIHLMESQKEVRAKGGTMRLGRYACTLKGGSLARKLYGVGQISERHRHRFEFNNRYRESFEAEGMRLSGVNEENDLVEILELPDHPYFIGCQFHPELKSRPMAPHPLFHGLIQAAKAKTQGQLAVPRPKVPVA